MKKTLSILMVLILMLLPAASLAQSDDVEIYVNDAGTYGFAYPSDWILLSKDTIDALIDEYVSLDEAELATTLQSMIPYLEQADIAMIMADNWSDNINVLRETTVKARTTDELLTYGSQIKAELEKMLPGIQFIEEPTLVEHGDYTYMMFAYLISVDNTMSFGVQACTYVDNSFYTFTLTAGAQDEAAMTEAADAFMTVLTTAELT